MVRRAVAASSTRRGALLGVLAALTGGMGVAEGRTRCPSGLTRCKVGKKKPCVDLTTDPAHCGACGTACAAGQTCVAGACTGTCIPTCDGRQCGDDGCGGSCGQCGGGERCRDGRCQESEDEWPIDPGLDGQCIADNAPCSEEDTCCDAERVCRSNTFQECPREPICCGQNGASCQDDCDCCGFRLCGEGTCFSIE